MFILQQFARGVKQLVRLTPSVCPVAVYFVAEHRKVRYLAIRPQGDNRIFLIHTNQHGYEMGQLFSSQYVAPDKMEPGFYFMSHQLNTMEIRRFLRISARLGRDLDQPDYIQNSEAYLALFMIWLMQNNYRMIQISRK